MSKRHEPHIQNKKPHDRFPSITGQKNRESGREKSLSDKFEFKNGKVIRPLFDFDCQLRLPLPSTPFALFAAKTSPTSPYMICTFFTVKFSVYMFFAAATVELESTFEISKQAL